VTVNGTLAPTGSGTPAITIINGFVLNGTANVGLGTQSSRLDFSGTQAFSGSGQVVMSAAGSNGLNSTGGTLTIGSGLLVHGHSGTVGAALRGLVNEGTIRVDVSGGVFTVTGAGWTNTGVIQADAGTTLNLAGTMTSSGLGTWIGAGATVNLVGSLDNTLATLALTASTGSLRLSGGTITGGTIAGTGGAVLLCTTSGGTLSGVTLNADLMPTGGSGTTIVTITGGLSLNGVASLGAGSTPTQLNFPGTQTLGGTGQVVFSNSNLNVLQPTSGGTLTIGAGITIIPAPSARSRCRCRARRRSPPTLPEARSE
jgi:hypothetical protein